MNLRYNLRTAADSGEHRHPQIVLKELGITYVLATPQSIADQWWIWSCKNLPAPLPAFLSELAITPHEAVGQGLTKEDADRLTQDAKS